MADEENRDGFDGAPRGPFGTALMVAGGTILLLAAFHQIGGLPFDMPRSWYQYRVLWFGMAVASLVAGFVMSAPPKGDERDTR